jgi:hypothetical protein
VGFILGFKDSSIYANQQVAYHIKIMKDKNHMIISLDTQKSFDKIQHLLGKVAHACNSSYSGGRDQEDGG